MKKERRVTHKKGGMSCPPFLHFTFYHVSRCNRVQTLFRDPVAIQRFAVCRDCPFNNWKVYACKFFKLPFCRPGVLFRREGQQNDARVVRADSLQTLQPVKEVQGGFCLLWLFFRVWEIDRNAPNLHPLPPPFAICSVRP